MTNATNWAGYVVTSDLQNPQPTITGVTASWIVPNVTPTSSDSFSAIWIGIGGNIRSDSSLIQCGTEQDSVGGSAVYSAWYELLPQTSRTVMSVVVSPGDQIQAFVQVLNPSFNTWTVNVTDITNHQSFQRNVTYPSSQLSAEWIVERPTVNRVIAPLANFGNVTITSCSATVGSVTGGISSFVTNKVVMFSSPPSSLQLADVSDLTPDGTAFTVTYLSLG